MARRSSHNAPPLPRAFMGHSEHMINVTLKRMAREQRHMAIRHLTCDDLLHLFIPAEQRQSLQEAFRITEFTSVDQHLEIQVPILPDYPIEYALTRTPLKADFAWDYGNCQDGFFVRRNLVPELQPDATPDQMEKIHYVFRELGRISFEFGLVRYVFQQLNQNGFCNTPQQMRYVWPAIRHIVDRADGMRDLAMSLVESSARAGDRARVPPHLKPFLIPTVDIVNRTLLMDKVDFADKRDFGLTVSDPSYTIKVGDTEISFAGING